MPLRAHLTLPERARPGPGRAAQRKSRPRGKSRTGFDLLQPQFCSLTKMYPSSVTLSSAFYRFGKTLFFQPSSFHKTAKNRAKK
jgi:hypothetical protein